MRIIAIIILFILLFLFIVMFSCVILEAAENELKKQRGIKTCKDICKDQKELGICSGQCEICVFNVNNTYPEEKCS